MKRRMTLALTLAATLLVGGTVATAADDETVWPQQATTLLDLSGLVSVTGICCRGDAEPTVRMLAAHDGKNPDENDRPRISVLRLTNSPIGVTWEPLAIEWPEDGQGPPNDLESAAAVPGTSSALFVESGDDGGPFHRIFHIELALDVPNAARLVEVGQWPVDPFNVEGSAVAAVDDGLIFVYAERAQGEPTTTIGWAPMTLSPMTFGDVEETTFTSPAVTGPMDRPVSAIEIAPDGTIYVASAFDSGDDAGPFASTVWRAGHVVADGEPAVVIDAEPTLIATIDAFKVESLAVHVDRDGTSRLYAGTDDEDYGGVLRPIPQEG